MDDRTQALAELRTRFGSRLDTGEGTRARLGRDASHVVGSTVGGVRPHDADEVVWLVRWARRHRHPLVARGGGTSLDGESVPLDEALVLDFGQWDEILEVDVVDRIARVRPGIVNLELQKQLAPHGLFFPPNPGSWATSTVGGNASTNASGPRSFRYGPTRHWVRAAEVVLGTGERISVGSRSAKRSVGPDLLELLLGSEGTLGIFTELTLSLAPRPLRRAGLAVSLPEGGRLALLAARLASLLPHGLTAVEYLDARCASALASEPGARLPTDGAVLLMEVESSDAEEEARRLQTVSELLRAEGVVGDVHVVPDADRLWTIRGASGPALDRLLGERVREDVAVPVRRIDEFLASLHRLGVEHGAPVAVYGHLGEGSFHPNVVRSPGTLEGEAARAALLRETLRLGGTISGEHGIGFVKPSFLEEQVGPAAVRWLRDVKRSLDPDGILNPGKLVPA